MSNVELYSLSKLRLTDFPKPETIIKGLLSEGETVLLVGKPKIGKSRLAQQLTICLSRGEPFLGLQVPKARRVVYCDLENRPAGVKSRFERMSAPNPGDELIHLYAPDTLADNTVTAASDGVLRLAAMVEETKPDVLIIDPWRLFVGRDGNSEEVVMAGLKALSELRQRHPKLATILIHHLRKQQGDFRVTLRSDPHAWVEAASGHYALVGHSDATFGLEREFTNAGEELIVFGGVARAVVPPILLLEEDEETLLFDLCKDGDALEKLLTPAEMQIWTVARRLRRFTFTQLLQTAGTTNRKAVSKTIRKAEAQDRLTRDGAFYTVVEGLAIAHSRAA